jgi:hypothetical protein
MEHVKFFHLVEADVSNLDLTYTGSLHITVELIVHVADRIDLCTIFAKSGVEQIDCVNFDTNYFMLCRYSIF